MSVKIKINWDNENVVSESVRIYRSNSTFTSLSLPPVLAEIFGDVYEYEDLDVIEGGVYYYMLSANLGEQRAFTDCFAVEAKLKPTGFWALAVACWGTATLPQFNKDLTTLPTWAENFKKTQDIISYVRAYHATTGNIATTAVATKTVDASMLIGKRFELVVSALSYNSNYGRMFLEFLDAFNNVIAALKVDRASNNFGSTLQIGNTLATVTNLSSIGTYPTANGYLDILSGGIRYTPRDPNSTTRYNEYTFAKDMTSLAKLRISSLGAHQTQPSGTGSSAYVYLKLLP